MVFVAPLPPQQLTHEQDDGDETTNSVVGTGLRLLGRGLPTSRPFDKTPDHLAGPPPRTYRITQPIPQMARHMRTAPITYMTKSSHVGALLRFPNTDRRNAMIARAIMVK
jgi:hypothetical protein